MVGERDRTAERNATVGHGDVRGTELAELAELRRERAFQASGARREEAFHGLADRSLERLEDNQKHCSDQHRQRGNLVDPAIEDVAMTVAVMAKVQHQFAEPNVMRHQNRDQDELGIEQPPEIPYPSHSHRPNTIVSTAPGVMMPK